jgi:hypothetical protein
MSDCTHPSVTVCACFPKHGERIYVESHVCNHCGMKVGERTEYREWPPFVGIQERQDTRSVQEQDRQT